MARTILEQRAPIATLIAVGAGTVSPHAYSTDGANVYLQIIELQSSARFCAGVRHPALRFTAPFIAAQSSVR